MTRVVVVDLLCNSPYYCGPMAAALRAAGADAELASPQFYLEPSFLDPYPRSTWIRDLVVHASRPRFVRLTVRAVELAWNLLGLLARIRSGRYDVVHVQWVPMEERTSLYMRVLRAACDRSGTLLVLTTHNAMPHDRADVEPASIRRNLDRADLLVAQTEHVAHELVGQVRTRTPIEVIPHGPLFIDQRLPSRGEASERLSSGLGPTVLFLGLIRQYKGLDLLDEAWPEVQATIPDARLLVVGKVLDPEAAHDLDRLRGRSGVEVVDRYVSVARMLDFYAVSDVVVFPYHRISQSGALMTAAGLGRPIVVTPIEGLQEQARGLTSAIVADDVSGPAIARALLEALQRLDELSRAADRDRDAIADSPIGWAAVATATIAAYDAHASARRLGDRAS